MTAMRLTAQITLFGKRLAEPRQTEAGAQSGGCAQRQRLMLVTERDHVPVWHGCRAGATRTGSPGSWG